MTLGDGEVVGVVSRCDLQRAGAELGGHIGVVDHRNRAVQHRHQTGAADQVAVAFVVWMHGYGGVAQDRLGAGGGHGNVALARPLVQAVAGQRVLEVVERALLVGVLHLHIADGGLQAGRPVDDVLALVDQPHPVQAHERLVDRDVQPIVQRETLTVPVAARAQPPYLAGDAAVLFVLPGPAGLQKALATQLLAAGSFVAQLAFDLKLRRDAGVVSAWHPQGGLA